MRPYLFSLIILITTLRNIKIFSSNTLIYLINHYVKEHFLYPFDIEVWRITDSNR